MFTTQQTQPQQKPQNYAPKPATLNTTPQTIDFTARDKEFLTYLLEMKFMTMDQAQKKFLLKGDIHIKEMIGYKFINFNGMPVKEDTLLVPSMNAHRLLTRENPSKEFPTPIKRIFNPAVNHDLRLVDLRMKFENLGFIERWYSEKVLETVPLMKRAFRNLPDAVCKKKNGKSYFLELEISKKAGSVYEERIKEYENVLSKPEIKEAGVEGVIFLAMKEDVLALIKEKLPSLRSFSALPYSRYMDEAK